jgi:hypothetical protein
MLCEIILYSRVSITFQNLAVRVWRPHCIGRERKGLYFGSHKPKSGVNDSETSTNHNGSPAVQVSLCTVNMFIAIQ